MKKLLGRINTKKIIITMLLLDLANVIIQTSLTLSAEIIQKPNSANKITITFNNSIIVIVAIIGTIICIIGVLALFNLQREYYVRKLKESQDQYINDTTELAQLHEINKAEYLEKIRRLQEENLSVCSELRKVQTERLNLSSAYNSLAFKYGELQKQLKEDKT